MLTHVDPPAAVRAQAHKTVSGLKLGRHKTTDRVSQYLGHRAQSEVFFFRFAAVAPPNRPKATAAPPAANPRISPRRTAPAARPDSTPSPRSSSTTLPPVDRARDRLVRRPSPRRGSVHQR